MMSSFSILFLRSSLFFELSSHPILYIILRRTSTPSYSFNCLSFTVAMKLTVTSTVLSVLFGSLVSAGPVKRAQKSRMSMNAASGTTVGAAYFITNEPDGNFVVSADIGSDGKLNLRQAVSAGGIGSHGNDGGVNGPDPLFTQGAVKASAASQMLVTVNSGSNTISLFSIDPTNPSQLKMVGKPVGSGGEFPVSVAFNKAGTAVCALNGGEVNSVSCFKADKTTGLVALTQTNRSLNLNQTTPATGPAGSASHIIFSEDGSQLIASIKGDPTTKTPGFLATFDVASDGSLSQDFKSVVPGTGGLLPFSMTIIPGKNAILATDAAIGFDIFDMTNGNKSSVTAIDGQGATCWSSFSPKTGNFYLTDITTSMVTEVNVSDDLKSSIVKQYPQGSGVATIDNDIASIGQNDFMFVLTPNATAVNVLSLNAPGQAQNIQKVDIAKPAKAAGLKISASQLQGMTTFIKK
ncbi:hypothetical protein C8J56DRAFT_930417 [Mycena floridula]|nr:hypothetical protein C8J56DRAFT_930417 [Mycena floridula]